MSSSSTLTQDEDAYDDLSPERGIDLDLLSKSGTPATSTGDERSPETEIATAHDCKPEEGKFLTLVYLRLLLFILLGATRPLVLWYLSTMIKICLSKRYLVFLSCILCVIEMTAEERLAKQRSQGAIPKRRPVKEEDSEATKEQSKNILLYTGYESLNRCFGVFKKIFVNFFCCHQVAIVGVYYQQILRIL